MVERIIRSHPARIVDETEIDTGEGIVSISNRHLGGMFMK